MNVCIIIQLEVKWVHYTVTYNTEAYAWNRWHVKMSISMEPNARAASVAELLHNTMATYWSQSNKCDEAFMEPNARDVSFAEPLPNTMVTYSSQSNKCDKTFCPFTASWCRLWFGKSSLIQCPTAPAVQRTWMQSGVAAWGIDLHPPLQRLTRMCASCSWVVLNLPRRWSGWRFKKYITCKRVFSKCHLHEWAQSCTSRSKALRYSRAPCLLTGAGLSSLMQLAPDPLHMVS